MTDKISFPPLRELPPGHREVRKQHLLSEIASEPRSARLFTPSRSWKSVLVVAILGVMLVGAVGVGVAASLGVFGAYHGISAVQHPRTGADVIDPATEAYMERSNCTQPNGDPCAPMMYGLQFDNARHLAQLPDGQNIYVLGCAKTDLCTVVGPPHGTFEDNTPLSKSHPSTIFTYLASNDSDSSASRWFTFGVALDGATSVSFDLGGDATGPQVTVPVKNNFWIYEGPAGDSDVPNVLQPLTVHFADGTSVTMPATGPNCAAC